MNHPAANSSGRMILFVHLVKKPLIKFILIYREKTTEDIVLQITNKYFDYLQTAATCNSLSSGAGAILANNPELVILEHSPHDNELKVLIECLVHIPFKLMVVYPLHTELPKSLKFHLFRQWDKPLNDTQITKDLIDATYAIMQQRLGQGNHTQQNTEKRNLLAVHCDNEIHLIRPNDILWLSSEGAYTRIHVAGKPPLLVSKNLKQLTSQLDPGQFFRTHHSFVVNIHQVEKFTKTNGGQLVLFNGTKIPVSDRKKAELLIHLENQ